MRRERVTNNVILLIALITAIAPLFAITSKNPWTSGGSMGLGALIAIKGISRLRCTLSDVVLAAIVLGLVLIEVFTIHKTTASLLLDAIAVSLVIVYASTGLTFKMIATNQHASRRDASNGRS